MNTFRRSGGRRDDRGGGDRQRSWQPNPENSLFDPEKPDAELFDQIAWDQAEKFARLDQRKIPASQLRRFFSEIKELYRRFNSQVAANGETSREEIYKQFIEPQFKMMRSKVAYAVGRQGGSPVPREFADFLSEGVKKVESAENFRRFVMHFEAVVGFMYGKDALSK